MIAKSILSAAIVTAGLVTLYPVAQATSAEVRDHRSSKTVRDHRKKFSCIYGWEHLWRRGFNSVKYSNCSGQTYNYAAVKNDLLYRADMNPVDGSFRFTLISYAPTVRDHRDKS